MTVKQLRELLEKHSSEYYDDMEFQVWLPGTYIELVGQPFYHERRKIMLIEGHVIEGGFNV